VKIVGPRLVPQQLSDTPTDEVTHRAAVRAVEEVEPRHADHADCAPSAPLLERQEQPALLGESRKAQQLCLGIPMRSASQVGYQSLEVLRDADVDRVFLRELTLEARDLVCGARADRLKRFLLRHLE
jgi:hypothetical protein